MICHRFHPRRYILKFLFVSISNFCIAGEAVPTSTGEGAVNTPTGATSRSLVDQDGYVTCTYSSKTYLGGWTRAELDAEFVQPGCTRLDITQECYPECDEFYFACADCVDLSAFRNITALQSSWYLRRVHVSESPHLASFAGFEGIVGFLRDNPNPNVGQPPLVGNYSSCQFVASKK